MFKKNVSRPDARILRLRAYEERLARMQAEVKSVEKVACLADWEASTDRKIVQNAVQREFDELRAERTARLYERREALASLLYAEEAQYNAELLQNQEGSAAERRSKMAAQARELAAAREAERQALADQLMQQRFREDCDPLRELYSQKVLLDTVSDREAQIEEKRQLRKIEAAETLAFDRMAHLEHLKKEKRAFEDSQKGLDATHKMMTDLDRQMADKQTRQACEQAVEDRDVAMLKDSWARADAAAAAAEAATRARNAAVAQSVKEFNLAKREHDDQLAAEEAARDRQFLESTLAAEAADAARDAAAADRHRREMAAFRTHMEAMLCKSEEDSSEQDAAVEAYRLAQEAKQDAAQAAADAARRELMAEVLATRQEQIAEKEIAVAAAAAREVSDCERLIREEAAMNELEVHYKLRARKDAMEKRLHLEAQIAAKAQAARIAAAEAAREAAAAKEQEAAFYAAVKYTCGNVEPVKYHGRKKVEWFH